MNRKIKKITFCIVAFALVFSLLGCSKGDVKITEATNATKATQKPQFSFTTPKDEGCQVEEIFDDCYSLRIGNAEEYIEYIRECPTGFQEPIIAASIDGLRIAIKSIRHKQHGTVVLCSKDEGKMIVDFNKMYVPVFPEDFYISFVMTYGERNGLPKYSYTVVYGKDVILGGDGNVDFHRTLEKDNDDFWENKENDIFIFNDFGIHHMASSDDFKEHEEFNKLEKYVLEDGNKRIIARYNEKDLIVYVIRDKVWYLVRLDGYFDHVEEFPSDEWFLSFDMVKYIT